MNWLNPGRALVNNVLLLALLLSMALPLRGQYHANLDQSHAQEAIWVDSVFRSMTFEERLGQLFMIRAHSNLGADHVASVERLIRNYHVGGLCFFQGTPSAQVRLVNRYQGQSKLPMMIAMDGEWGLNMRMKTVMRLPRQLMLGAIRNNHLIYEMGQEVARQMHRVGVHINFAPVVDVNNNPNNPVIGTRSFGEDRVNVAIKGVHYMKGMQDHGIVACAKHFPGHGDTDVDSHYDLPVINHDLPRLDSIELYPFKALVEQGVGSIMVGHLQVPALENRENHPTSLSPATINGMLQTELNFHGLTFTDGLGMKGVTKHFGDGEVEAAALLAGNDILLLPVDLGAAEARIKAYIAEGQLTEAEVNRKVKRVLRAKYRMGLQHFNPLSELNVLKDINTPEAEALRERLVENALTLVRNENQLVPVQEVGEQKIASLAIGTGSQPLFQKRLRDYGQVDALRIGNSIGVAEEQNLMDRLAEEDLVIVSLHNMGRSSRSNFGLQPSVLQFLERLEAEKDIILVVFGNPYSLKFFDGIGAVLAAYNEDDLTQDKAAQAIFGAIGIDGRLPVTASERSRYNSGVTTSPIFRLGYSTPENAGMDSDTLRYYIDQLAKEAIADRATPGCVVLVARHGKVVFHEAYGHHTYARRRSVSPDDIYDLASITKISATTIALMDLVQKGILDLDKTLGYYLTELQGTNKDHLSLREILAHRAALKPWIPFYAETLDNRGRRLSDLYRSTAGGAYQVQVAPNIFMHETYIDSIWHSIDVSELRANNNYRYSDLGFYYLAKLVEKASGSTLDQYVADQFYRSLGLYNIDFNPRERFSLRRIPPTEVDNYWRKQAVHGYVHDMGAAMLGGISGHAGLFGNAHDLAVIGQMLIQNGVYGNEVYLTSDVIEEFASRFPGESRRGLGFDMKQMDPGRSMNMANSASSKAFGHLGFTGTSIWIDPAEELVFIFLSNRTYPSMRNNKLSRDSYRTRMQEVAYRSITRSAIMPPPVEPIPTGDLPAHIESARRP